MTSTLTFTPTEADLDAAPDVFPRRPYAVLSHQCLLAQALRGMALGHPRPLARPTPRRNSRILAPFSPMPYTLRLPSGYTRHLPSRPPSDEALNRHLAEMAHQDASLAYDWRRARAERDARNQLRDFKFMLRVMGPLARKGNKPRPKGEDVPAVEAA